MPKIFIKRVEDFTCEHCGKPVKGNGYTNHCPFCLWGKHVDIQPGDRLGKCLGMMKPIQADVSKGQYVLLHVCMKCSTEKRNVVSPNDSFDELVKVQKAFADAPERKH